MKRLPHIAVLITLLSCDFNPAAEAPMAAAHELARRYASQQLQIDAAGHDCRILLVQSKKSFDATYVESLHYGSDAYEGGIQQFAEDEKFRAVVYRDASGKLWTYRATSFEEATDLQPCE